MRQVGRQNDMKTAFRSQQDVQYMLLLLVNSSLFAAFCLRHVYNMLRVLVLMLSLRAERQAILCIGAGGIIQ